MRLIDADALKKEIVDLKLKLRSENQDYYTGYICALSVVEGMIAYAPTIDAVPVCRCKDCKHNYGLTHGGEYCSVDIVCDYWATDGLSESDFCSYGERMEGDG